MVSCIEIETASLIFASLSVLTTSVSFLWFGTSLVRACISVTKLVTASDKKYSTDVIKATITSYGLYISVTLSILLSILVVTLAFSIILAKGLISKNSHLVKAYFIYGIIWTTIVVVVALYLTLIISVKVGLYIFLGCFMYSLILMMIKKTYLKLAASEHDKCCPKNVAEQKTISIKL